MLSVLLATLIRSVICSFGSLGYSSISNLLPPFYWHTNTACHAVVVARSSIMSSGHSQARFGPFWWGPINKCWIYFFWLRNALPSFGLIMGCWICFRLWLGFGDLLPRRQWAEGSLCSRSPLPLLVMRGKRQGFSSRMSSLLPFVHPLSLELNFLLRWYQCAPRTDALSVSACAAWFLSLLKFESRVRATVFWVWNVW